MRLKGNQRSTQTRIRVRMIRLNWLFIKDKNSAIGDKKEKNFLELIETLDQIDDDSLYGTAFVEALLNMIWKTRGFILNWVFIPQLLQFFSVILINFMLIHHPQQDGFKEYSVANKILTGIIALILVITSGWFLYLETLQARLGTACRSCSFSYGFRKYIIGASLPRDVLSNILHFVQLTDAIYCIIKEDA